MSELESSIIYSLLFGLRCVAPLALTLAIGYLMNRLVDRWEAEETRSSYQEEVELAQATKSSGGIKLPVVTLPCWLVRKCDPAKRDNCPAYKQQGIPCWQARLRVEGQMPDSCPACPIYAQALGVSS
jgi:hypothetical protein